MKPIFFMTAALLMSSHMGVAAVTAESIAADLKAQGFTRVEIKQGDSQIKAEALRGTEKLEAIYDAATGDVLKASTYGIGADESRETGVSIRDADGDFVGNRERERERNRNRNRNRNGENGSDDSDDNSDDSANGSDDDHSDSESGSDHDDGNDDNGSNGGSDSGDHDSGDHDTGDNDGGDNGDDDN